MKNIINTIALVLITIGAINWGLVGIANIDLVADLFGPMTVLTKTIYGLVGISGVYIAINRFFTPIASV